MSDRPLPPTLEAEKLRILAENAMDVVWTMELDGQISFVSPSVEEMRGLTVAEAMAQPIDEILTPPSQAIVLDYFAHLHTSIAAGQTPRNFRGDLEYYAKDGTTFWTEVFACPLRGPDGQWVQVLGITRNIHDRKRYEQELKQAHDRIATLNAELEQRVRERTAELSASQAKFQRLVEDIGSNFVVFSHTGLDGIITYVSGGFKTVFGITKDKILSHSWEEAVNWLWEDKRRVQEIVANVSRERDFEPFEMRFMHPQGQIRTVRVNQHAVWDETGELVAIDGILEDITQRKAEEKLLQQTNRELRRANEMKDAFLAMMSHELRTPLNSILGNTEILQEEIFGAINDQQLTVLHRLESSANHLLALINDILDISQIAAGQVSLDQDPVAIAPLCRSSLELVQPQADQKRITLRCDLAPTLPDLWGDERRLRQVLINLLNNGVKFTPEGGQVTLTATPIQTPNDDDNPGLRLSVSDTGIGIAPENIPHLFTPFMQIDSALSRQYEGTGLGLALVKQLVELHGGQVSVTSTVGVGSTFVVELPGANQAEDSFSLPFL